MSLLHSFFMITGVLSIVSLSTAVAAGGSKVGSGKAATVAAPRIFDPVALSAHLETVKTELSKNSQIAAEDRKAYEEQITSIQKAQAEGKLSEVAERLEALRATADAKGDIRGELLAQLASSSVAALNTSKTKGEAAVKLDALITSMETDTSPMKQAIAASLRKYRDQRSRLGKPVNEKFVKSVEASLPALFKSFQKLSAEEQTDAQRILASQLEHGADTSEISKVQSYLDTPAGQSRKDSLGVLGVFVAAHTRLIAMHKKQLQTTTAAKAGASHNGKKGRETVDEPVDDAEANRLAGESLDAWLRGGYENLKTPEGDILRSLDSQIKKNELLTQIKTPVDPALLKKLCDNNCMGWLTGKACKVKAAKTAPKTQAS